MKSKERSHNPRLTKKSDSLESQETEYEWSSYQIGYIFSGKFKMNSLAPRGFLVIGAEMNLVTRGEPSYWGNIVRYLGEVVWLLESTVTKVY